MKITPTTSPILDSVRAEFDSRFEAILESLPSDVRELIERIPILIEDEPTEDFLRQMGIPEDGLPSDLCGAHWGVPLTEQSVGLAIEEPERVYLFRGPILRLAGDEPGALEQEIRITLLHELGHHFGLDDDDLDELGFR